jgi:hypothetical protein
MFIASLSIWASDTVQPDAGRVARAIPIATAIAATIDTSAIAFFLSIG